MLTADLIRANCKEGEVQLRPLHGLSRKRMLQLAEPLVCALRSHSGKSVRELQAAWAAVESGPREQKAKDALCKLLLDDSELSDQRTITLPSGEVLEPWALRMQLVRAAAAARARGEFERQALLSAHGLPHDPGELEALLFADRPELRQLLRPSALRAEGLVDDFDRQQARALLLSATQLTLWLPEGATRSLRRLWRRSKFLGLLLRAVRQNSEIEIVCDGPASVLRGAPRYGLLFANLFPELEGLSAYRLEAEVRLSARQRGVFRWQGGHGRDDVVEDALDAEISDLQERLQPHVDWIAPASELLIGQHGAALLPDLTLQLGGKTMHIEWLRHQPMQNLAQRLEQWPAEARNLLVCVRLSASKTKNTQETVVKNRKKVKAAEEYPPWVFGYRRTLATEKLLGQMKEFAYG